MVTNKPLNVTKHKVRRKSYQSRLVSRELRLLSSRENHFNLCNSLSIFRKNDSLIVWLVNLCIRCICNLIKEKNFFFKKHYINSIPLQLVAIIYTKCMVPRETVSLFFRESSYFPRRSRGKHQDSRENKTN